MSKNHYHKWANSQTLSQTVTRASLEENPLYVNEWGYKYKLLRRNSPRKLYVFFLRLEKNLFPSWLESTESKEQFRELLFKALDFPPFLTFSSSRTDGPIYILSICSTSTDFSEIIKLHTILYNEKSYSISVQYCLSMPILLTNAAGAPLLRRRQILFGKETSRFQEAVRKLPRVTLGQTLNCADQHINLLLCYDPQQLFNTKYNICYH